MKIIEPLGVFKYKIVRVFSYLLRYLFCCLTIEQVPIFENETVQWIYSAFFGGVSYFLLQGICYPIVRYISRLNGIKSSAIKSGIYFVFYIPLTFVTFIILSLLTKLGILPIGQEFTFNILEWVIQKISDIIIWAWNLLAHFLINLTESISENLS